MRGWVSSSSSVAAAHGLLLTRLVVLRTWCAVQQRLPACPPCPRGVHGCLAWPPSLPQPLPCLPSSAVTPTSGTHPACFAVPVGPARSPRLPRPLFLPPSLCSITYSVTAGQSMKGIASSECSGHDCQRVRCRAPGRSSGVRTRRTVQANSKAKGTGGAACGRLPFEAAAAPRTHHARHGTVDPCASPLISRPCHASVACLPGM